MIQVLVNSTDITSEIVAQSLEVQQVLGAQRDTARFSYKKYGSKTYIPEVLDIVEIYDGDSKIFGGRVVRITETNLSGPDGLVFAIECADYSFDLDSLLVSETYSNQTVNDIIADIIDTYASGFTYINVDCGLTITKVVFNQVPVSQCIKRLADMVKFDWYIDPDKDLHFFSKFINPAPYDLTDTSGNYIALSLVRRIDGTQIANVVKVRGAEYEAATLQDIITVNGNTQTTFKLPYKFSDLAIWLDTGAGYVSKTVGIDFIDDFTSKDVLYNYNDQTIRFQSALADGNKIKFSGNPKVRVLAVASDADSIATYGIREKLIEDTSIEDLTTARKRAIAEVAAYKEEQNEIKFDTYTAGLRAGMVINLTSTRRNSDIDFIIRTVRFKPIKPDTYAYSVELVTTKKYDLTELLQSIIQPENLQYADSETTEDIRTDIQDLVVVESIDKQIGSAITDNATITVSENLQKDPLGAGIEPTWVLGTYFPSSISDTKRDGLLDRSFKLY